MAIAAAFAAVAGTAYGAISQNQVRQEAKGQASTLIDQANKNNRDAVVKAQTAAAATNAQRTAAASKTGFAGTIVTSPEGVTSPMVGQKKTLLGL